MSGWLLGNYSVDTRPLSVNKVMTHGPADNWKNKRSLFVNTHDTGRLRGGDEWINRFFKSIKCPVNMTNYNIPKL